MSQKTHVGRLSAAALVAVVGAGLALAGCGGSGSSSTASGGNSSGGSPSFAPVSAGSGSGDSAACAAFATSYKKFLAGYAPPESQTGTNESPLTALSDAVNKISASGQLNRDLANLGIDAGLIATGSTEGGQTTPPSAFYSDLQAVGKDCGTMFTRPRVSLVRAG